MKVDFSARPTLHTREQNAICPNSLGGFADKGTKFMCLPIAGMKAGRMRVEARGMPVLFFIAFPQSKFLPFGKHGLLPASPGLSCERNPLILSTVLKEPRFRTSTAPGMVATGSGSCKGKRLPHGSKGFSTFYDPFRNACLEAMAAGIPVLTTTKNDFGELVEDQQNGFLVHDPKNHWEISERILAFYHSSQKKYIGGKSRITRLQLDIDSVVQRVLSIYAESKRPWAA